MQLFVRFDLITGNRALVTDPFHDTDLCAPRAKNDPFTVLERPERSSRSDHSSFLTWLSSHVE